LAAEPWQQPPPRLRPPRRETPGIPDDTVSDQARDTFKGLEDQAYVGPLLRKSDSGASLPRARPFGSSVGKAPSLRLPQAKPLDGKGPETKPSDRNGASGLDLDAGAGGAAPIFKVGDERLSSGTGRRVRSGQKVDRLIFVWIAIAVVALISLAVLAFVLMNSGPSDNKQPSPGSGKRRSTAQVAPHSNLQGIGPQLIG
jgi:hypothetical protein